MVIVHDKSWKEQSLDLRWYRIEVGKAWSSARGIVWRLNEPRVPALASVKIDNQKYEISTFGLYGLTDKECELLKKWLGEMGLTPKEAQNGI